MNGYTISSPQDIRKLRRKLRKSAERTKQRLLQLAKSNKDAISLLADLKFKPVGFAPLDSEKPFNLIEQLNQTFTDLATLKATEYLFKKYPSVKSFTVNLGPSPGRDIWSESGSIAAEVFSAVNPNRNNKLRHDCRSVSKTKKGEKPAKHKYVFFWCPNKKPGKQKNVFGFPRVKIVAVSYPNISLE